MDSEAINTMAQAYVNGLSDTEIHNFSRHAFVAVAVRMLPGYSGPVELIDYVDAMVSQRRKATRRSVATQAIAA